MKARNKEHYKKYFLACGPKEYLLEPWSVETGITEANIRYKFEDEKYDVFIKHFKIDEFIEMFDEYFESFLDAYDLKALQEENKIKLAEFFLSELNSIFYEILYSELAALGINKIKLWIKDLFKSKDPFPSEAKLLISETILKYEEFYVHIMGDPNVFNKRKEDHEKYHPARQYTEEHHKFMFDQLVSDGELTGVKIEVAAKKTIKHFFPSNYVQNKWKSYLELFRKTSDYSKFKRIQRAEQKNQI